MRSISEESRDNARACVMASGYGYSQELMRMIESFTPQEVAYVCFLLSRWCALSIAKMPQYPPELLLDALARETGGG